MGCICQGSRVRPKTQLRITPGEEAKIDTQRGHTDSTTSTQSVIRWKQGALLGQGAYGQVYECFNVDTGQLYALKHVELSGDPEKVQGEVANLQREVLSLRELSHKNIVKYIHAGLSDDRAGVDIIMEFAPGGSVRMLLNKFSRFEEKMARIYIKQVLEGLSYLHHKGIIHRDLKCANILVGVDSVIKITDFGASKRLSSDQVNEEYVVCKSLKGSPYWMAPEIARRSGHSYPADIWSVGCTLIEMLTGKPPWSDLSQDCKVVLSLISKATSAPSYPSSLSPECRSFLDNCLQVLPESRPSADQLLTHCFVRGDVGTIEELSILMSRPGQTQLPSPILESGANDGVKVVFPKQISLRNKHCSPILKETTDSKDVFFPMSPKKKQVLPSLKDPKKPDF